jgi:hypothetical protein
MAVTVSTLSTSSWMNREMAHTKREFVSYHNNGDFYHIAQQQQQQSRAMPNVPLVPLGHSSLDLLSLLFFNGWHTSNVYVVL